MAPTGRIAGATVHQDDGLLGQQTSRSTINPSTISSVELGDVMAATLIS
jgi:hypothetical protein